MTTFKTFRSVFGVSILLCMVLGERDERKRRTSNRLAVQTNGLRPRNIAGSPSPTESVGAPGSRDIAGAPSFTESAGAPGNRDIAGAPCPTGNASAPGNLMSPATDLMQAMDSTGYDCTWATSFRECAMTAGCEWISETGQCIDGCLWRSKDQGLCMKQYDRACMWTAGEYFQCQRIAQCVTADNFTGIVNYLQCAQQFCSDLNIPTNRCACWHGSSVPKLEGMGITTVCKLCSMCQGAPYENYAEFKEDCIDPYMGRMYEQQQELAEQQKMMQIIEREKNYDYFYAAWQNRACRQ